MRKVEDIAKLGRGHCLWAALLVATAGALLLASLAPAEGPPARAEYVSQLEGICKPHALATQRTMKGVRAEVKAEQLKLAAKKFSRATQLFDSTVSEISAVPRPPADSAKLAKWFVDLGHQESYLKAITAQLSAGHTISAQRLTARFIKSGNEANNTVLSFGFNYCSFKFSRYG
ncbi:MAG: hypothetical protein WB507_14410 [Solirubrobacterales bacterium]